MLDFPRWKQAWYWFLTAVACVAALPSLVSLSEVRWPDVLPRPMVNLGLDLAGGSHILLEADTGQVVRQRLETMEEDVRNKVRRAEPRIEIGDISTRGGALTFMLASLGFVAMHQCQRNLVGLQMNFAGVDPVFAGQSAEFRIAVTNHARNRRYGLQLLSGGNSSEVWDLGPGESQVFQLELPTERRGIIEL